MKTLRAGVIGLGKKGFLYDIEGKRKDEPHSHVRAYQSCKEVDLVAAADTDENRALQFHNYNSGVKTYSDVEKMLYESKLDILSIATPTGTHCRLVRLAARYHPIKVIFVEKPIASTVRDAERMIHTCKEFGVRLVVNHTRRWDLQWINAHKLLGEIGPVLSTVGYCSGDPLEAGVHMADLFRWFGGDAPYDYIDLMMKDKPYDPYLVFELDVFGQKGRLKISDNGRTISIYKVKESGLYKRFRELWFDRSPLVPNSDTPMLRAIEHLVEVAFGLSEPLSSGEDGLEALKIALEWIK